MMTSKYTAALLVDEIGHQCNILIQRQAISFTLDDIKYCNDLIVSNASTATHGDSKTNIVTTEASRSTLIKLLSSLNSYTIIAYPVAYHLDILKKGDYSLENKIYFDYDVEGKDKYIGRGGGGGSKFTCALLHWDKSNTTKSRHLQYTIMGSVLKPNERLTKAKWVKKLGLSGVVDDCDIK